MESVFKALNILVVFGMSSFWKMEILLQHVQMELSAYGHQIKIELLIQWNLIHMLPIFLNTDAAGIHLSL